MEIGRVYEAPDGRRRLLVDRLWPRGLRRDDPRIDQWLPAVAPSTELRRWYGHRPELFDEFVRRYETELATADGAAALERLGALAAEFPSILVTATHDPSLSHAAVLARLLDDGGPRRVGLATGAELAVHEHGDDDGEPVLLLHAWGETHRVFDRLVPLLPRSLRLVVPDQRGVGDSTKPAGGYTLADAAADVVALLDALGLEQCWLAGTSSGGYVAQQVAMDHPGRVRGLVLIGTPGDLRRPLPAAFAGLLASLPDPLTRADADALIGAIPLHTRVPAAFLDDQLAAALTIPGRVWRAVADGLVGAVPPIRRGPIAVPTLILWGTEEDVLPAGQGRELAAAIEGSRLVTYEGTGHLVLWERPERVAADLAAFVAGVRR
ncbi:alpha/beta fold hydrolase [Jiangella muralis]|uniref:alpha/beta fold hydrolase n=1 Tax=Jiangella muralis TaxID=702383 RepID=UPI00147084D2|nr:alpha/beta fold hydrolase [Jiangella muralis]